MNKALAHMEKVYRILEGHIEEVWTIAVELYSAHKLLEEEEEHDGEEDDMTIITTFVSSAAISARS